MRSGAKGVRVSESSDDEALRAHGTRDDAQLALTRTDRALAGHEHVFVEVSLSSHVVVVAKNGRIELNLAKSSDQNVLEQAEHQRSVR
jgi:hypothetical protein